MSLLRHAGRVLSFLGVYLGQFLAANVRVAWEIVTPRSGLAPAVVTLPLRCRTDAEVASYISLVGLTPGTLVIDSRDDRADGADVVVTVHAMHAADPARTTAQLQDLEDRMLTAWRNTDRPVREDS